MSNTVRIRRYTFRHCFTNLSFSSLQLFSPAESNSSPESCRLLLLRFNSLKQESVDCSTDARVSQDWTVSLEPAKLQNKRISYTNTSPGKQAYVFFISNSVCIIFYIVIVLVQCLFMFPFNMFIQFPD